MALRARLGDVHFWAERTILSFYGMFVAPNFVARSRRDGFTSMAMIVAARACTAPWMQERPTPPQPSTTTELPAFAFAALVTEPKPIITPQPSSAADRNGIATSILVTACRGQAGALVAHDVRETAVQHVEVVWQTPLALISTSTRWPAARRGSAPAKRTGRRRGQEGFRRSHGL